MKLSERIDLLTYLGACLKKEDDTLEAEIIKTYHHNRWFVKENIKQTIADVIAHFLQKEKLENWISKYEIEDAPKRKKIALVLGDTIPLIGFQDVLSVFVAGHISKIKCSEKDKFLIPYFIKVMAEADERVNDFFEIIDRLSDFDAVIAAGSDKSLGPYEMYFGKYPNIIRKNKHSVGVLNGQETASELQALGKDIFNYFGLDSRSVSKIYVPVGFDFENFLEALHPYKSIISNDKYKNNFDYNYTLIILNGIAHKSNGSILLTEDVLLQSRIAQLHYEVYKNETDLQAKLSDFENQIECIVGQPVPGFQTIPFGQATQRALGDFDGGVDVMDFLVGFE